MTEIAIEYLIENGYADKIDYFIDNYKSHPDYPSLNAVSETLTLIDINNIVFRVNHQEFDDLPDMFLGIIDDNLAIIKKDLDKVIIKRKDDEIGQFSYEDFFSKWNGIVILIDENLDSKKKKVPFSLDEIILLIILTLFYFFYNFFNPFFGKLSLAVFILSLIGIIFSIKIIKEKNNFSKYNTTSRLCKIHSSVSCFSVLNSEYSKINKWVDFTDLPIIYFSSITIYQLYIVSGYKEIIILSLFLTPFILFSIWIQKFKIKKWCILCLFISGVVISLSSLIFINGFDLSIKNLIYLTLITLTFGLFELKFKKINHIKESLYDENVELRRFKRKFELFNYLAKPVKLENELINFEKLIIGDQNVSITLTLILSPNCTHCYTTYINAKELQNKYSEILNVEIFFNVNPNHKTFDDLYLISRLYEIKKTDKMDVINALDDWFVKMKTFADWKRKWGNKEEKVQVEYLVQQYNWCINNGFNYTPVILINNKIYPDSYKIDELKYFINNLMN